MVYLLKMVIFHGYLKEPDGRQYMFLMIYFWQGTTDCCNFQLGVNHCILVVSQLWSILARSHPHLENYDQQLLSMCSSFTYIQWLWCGYPYSVFIEEPFGTTKRVSKHMIADWWFGFFYFSILHIYIYILGIVIPTDELHHLSEG